MVGPDSVYAGKRKTEAETMFRLAKLGRSGAAPLHEFAERSLCGCGDDGEHQG